MDVPVRVVKVGGSLFQRETLRRELADWLAAQIPAVHVLVAGGGALADAVRAWDTAHALGDEAAHRLALESLRVSTNLLTRLVPPSPSAPHVPSEPAANWIVFDPVNYLLEEEPQLPGTCLPASWDVTSDSIAARLAITLEAAELVLLKSVAPPLGVHALDDLERLAELGYVDRFLPRLQQELPPLRLVALGSSADVTLRR